MLEKNSQRLNMNRFIVEALEAHNKYRAYHNARPLVINDEISKIAQEVANHCAKIKKLEHSHRKFWDNYNQRYRQLGENLYSSYDQNKLKNPNTGHLPVARWYNEITMHDFDQEYQEDTGHFTQIVWKNSREIGFGVAYSDEEIFIVAQYFPPGNVWTKFGQNVERPITTYHIEPIKYQKKIIQSNDAVKISKTDISIPDPIIEYNSKLEELVSMYKKKSELKEKLKLKTIQLNNQNENMKPSKKIEPLIFHNNKLINKNVTFQNVLTAKNIKKSNINTNNLNKPIQALPIIKNVVDDVRLNNADLRKNHLNYYEKNNSIKTESTMRKSTNGNIYMNIDDARDFYATIYNINNPVQPVNRKILVKSLNRNIHSTPLGDTYLKKNYGRPQIPAANNIVNKEKTIIYSNPLVPQAENYIKYFYPNHKTQEMKQRKNYNQSNYEFDKLYDMKSGYPDNQSLIDNYMNIIQDYMKNKPRLDV